ncbi:AlbA family DNA-binding domain-containing protein [Paenibacillus polymyxa]|uniref:AlbA family DNA-binding domain-containing protein n=1 Tax=Paenibacillus polymyxa TaxID=1406 RepID=UPI001118B477|nr:ATP-binding protein [Paenibacillus polymyxa]QDA30251.1 ATP-binding protein [Paenibacillus polymyxa]
MTTFSQDFQKISEQDLQLLVQNRVIEGGQLEYKEKISNMTSLVEEIVAFANTKGGDLFIGIEEKDGFPDKIIGLELNDPSKELLKYEQAIRDATDPELNSVEVRAIPLANGRYVIALRVPRIRNGLHMVNHKVMVRAGSAKKPAGMAELRQLIHGEEHFNEKYEVFRSQQLQKLCDRYDMENSFVLVHYVPISSFESGVSYPVVENRQEINVFILGYNGANPTVNLDGPYFGVNIDGISGHTQVYRNGIVEQLSNRFFSANVEPKQMDMPSFERSLEDSILRQNRNFEAIGMTDPYYIFVNLLSVKGMIGSMVGNLMFNPPQPIDIDNVRLPGVLIESRGVEEMRQAVNQIVIQLWNGFGFSQRPQIY